MGGGGLGWELLLKEKVGVYRGEVTGDPKSQRKAKREFSWGRTSVGIKTKVETPREKS